MIWEFASFVTLHHRLVHDQRGAWTPTEEFDRLCGATIYKSFSDKRSPVEVIIEELTHTSSSGSRQRLVLRDVRATADPRSSATLSDRPGTPCEQNFRWHISPSQFNLYVFPFQHVLYHPFKLVFANNLQSVTKVRETEGISLTARYFWIQRIWDYKIQTLWNSCTDHQWYQLTNLKPSQLVKLYMR